MGEAMLDASLGVPTMAMPVFRTSAHIAPIHRRNMNVATLPALRTRPFPHASRPHDVIMLLYDVHSMFVARCLTAVALSLSLWDHALTLGREVQLLWRFPWSPLQILVLVNRYSAEISMIFIARIVGWGKLPMADSVCEALTILITVYCVINSASSQFAVLLYVYKLFDSSPLYRNALVVGFATCFSVSITFGILSVRQALGMIRSAPAMYCVVALRRRFTIGMWGGMVAYDLYVFFLLLVNTMHNPRRRDSEIVGRLLQGGALVFLACSALRLSQLLSSVLAVGAQSLLIPLVAWSIDGILTYRLLLKVKAVELVADGHLSRLWDPNDGCVVRLYHEVHVQER
ncbi:uncharacterized protein C8Q71DRAFT_303918 [Rhodofomes roseus]|uniref:DUF6533 domain-containing protein n=1 Tax=Rhodofomes roseus TaxID=34475 RepID=A0ABQ8K3J3_9APHY|nr:uncharacterized protein C8Q71DRAFT_303918 [Rhodofomes roseus]KAH9831446.1 hypothetical protein C8Q71DRAFT_303918 [Rhodofomes roseus]